MTVTTYTRTAENNIHALVQSIIKSLVGLQDPEDGPGPGAGKAWMRVVFPAGDDPRLGGITDIDDPDEFGAGSSPTTKIFVLESTKQIDPFARDDNQDDDPLKNPWRIAFHIHKWNDKPSLQSENLVPDEWNSIYSLAVYLGTPATLQVDENGLLQVGLRMTATQKVFGAYNGTAANYQPTYKGKDFIEPIGNTGAQWTHQWDPTAASKKYGDSPPQNYIPPSPPGGSDNYIGPWVANDGELFVNRYNIERKKYTNFGIDVNPAYANPMNYRLVCTNRGFWLGVWASDPEETANNYSWLLVQRPVDKRTGIMRGLDPNTLLPFTGENPSTGLLDDNYKIGTRPLFCVNSTDNKFYKFIVREHDIGSPSPRKIADENAEDSAAVLNSNKQQSLTENGEYVITFINNLNTARFRYADELDMIGTVSADVVGAGTDIDVSVYGEETKRTYHAMFAQGAFGTTMRIMVIKNAPDAP